MRHHAFLFFLLIAAGTLGFASQPASASPGCAALNGLSGTDPAKDPIFDLSTYTFGKKLNGGDKVTISAAPVTAGNVFVFVNGVSPSYTSWAYTWKSADTYVTATGATVGSAPWGVNYAITCASAAPTLTSASPSSGPGGTVTLTGTGFYGTFAVLFGGQGAASFTVNSDTSITVKTPAGTGTQVVSVVTDAGVAMAPNVTYTFNPPTIVLSTASLPDGIVLSPYSKTITAAGGTGPYTFSASGSLPPGLSLSSSGVLSGTPTAPGAFNVFHFTVTAKDSVGYIGSQAYTLTIGLAGQTITNFTATPASPAYAPGATFSASATGGASSQPVALSIDPVSASVCSLASSTITGSGSTAAPVQSSIPSAWGCSMPGLVAPGVPACGGVSGVVNILSAGTCRVVATEAGDANYASTSATRDVAIAQLAQSITFTSTPPAGATVGGTAYTVTASGGASGNPVKFSIDAASTAGACAIAGASVSFTATGTCIVDANQAGNTNYSAAPQQQQTIAVGKVPSSVALSSSANPSTQGAWVIFTTTVKSSAPANAPITANAMARGVGSAAQTSRTQAVAAATPTGSVTISDGATVLATVALVNGSATYATPFTTPGSHAITAAYSGDAMVAAASVSVVQVVSAADPVIPAPMFDRWTLALLGGLLAAIGFVRARSARSGDIAR